jgi:RNA 2',3'-cyclic 3'-phosphodiesterase
MAARLATEPGPGAAARHGDGKRGAGRVRWVRPDSFHLTLRFLGPTDPGRLDDVRSAVRAAADGVPPFAIELGRLAILGGSRSPTLVCEVSLGRENVETIEKSLSTALEPLGWSPERRPFRPHVTLARTAGRRTARPELGDVAAATTGAGIAWRVERIVLFESHLGAGPPRYEERSVAELRRPSALGTNAPEP